MEHQDLIKKIKEKKELKGIEDSFVLEYLKKELKKINKTNLSEKDIKEITKRVRSDLRLSAGRFVFSSKKQMELIKNNDWDSLLNKHYSTKERISFYEELKSKISSLKIKTILDIGCGLNPLVLAKNSEFYYASDIDNSNLDIVKEYFKKNNIQGKVFFHDLKKINSELPEVDLCLILKVFDVVSKNNSSLTEKILSNIKFKYLIASFPTKKLSGKNMNFPRRFWFERVLRKLSFSYSTFSSDNEIFYLIERS